MENTQLFAAVAEFYDYSMRENCDYSGWAEYIVTTIKDRCKNAVSGIDMACGTGFFTRALKRAGFNMTGVDLSSEMLTSAQKITAQESLYIPFMKGDMTNFKSFEKVDFITVINDGINCIPPEKIEKVFKCFNKCLKKGGILHFDVSSEYKLKNIIKDNTFCEDDDDYSYIWFNKPYEDKVVMDMSVFLKKGDVYIKRESTLTEYIHTVKSLKNSLLNCDFELISVEGDMGRTYSDTSERINITAVKK